jgi:NADPH:quinone reductase-like Zn-dependent oxidoreductase
MKAIVVSRYGEPELLEVREVEDPQAGEGEVLIKIVATALNKRENRTSPPPGASLYPGLECSGFIEAVGSGVSKWKVGDEVCMAFRSCVICRHLSKDLFFAFAYT